MRERGRPWWCCSKHGRIKEATKKGHSTFTLLGREKERQFQPVPRRRGEGSKTAVLLAFELAKGGENKKKSISKDPESSQLESTVREENEERLIPYFTRRDSGTERLRIEGGREKNGKRCENVVSISR